MSLSARQAQIHAHVLNAGRATVDALAQRFDTTPQTIRKDLQSLADAGLVERFHGGARAALRAEYMPYELRADLARAQKARIGQAVAALIPNQSSVFINAGTTTDEVARRLTSHSGIKLFTDNINTANEIRSYPGLEVIVAGGVVRASDGAIVGEEAVEFIRQFKVDLAIIGAASIDPDGTLLDYDFREAAVVRAITGNARHVILAADSSKIGRAAPIRIGHLSQVDSFVTDRLQDPGLRQLCADHGVALVEAR
ncbi:DeoR/GlpR family DNA-binding transcription regulator [Oceanomicrobium pacificus]|uniref:DeoR family transcriptional regulator n=1 Tax=Oceanomicrobium pacificus TaxID=2692916 RepID=A0A6B0TK12_9RHOB|nr:DeoR/GlpR family DNA-binding transcription regulator [Oceanomicrobium pacificus]MXU64787.1 DeoR family transcriptional regulator [Oceanomicrobium pacificus]